MCYVANIVNCLAMRLLWSRSLNDVYTFLMILESGTVFVRSFVGFGSVEVGVEIGVSVLDNEGRSEPDEETFFGVLLTCCAARDFSGTASSFPTKTGPEPSVLFGETSFGPSIEIFLRISVLVSICSSFAHSVIVGEYKN